MSSKPTTRPNVEVVREPASRRTAIVLFCAMVIVYLANARNVTTGDTWTSRSHVANGSIPFI